MHEETKQDPRLLRIQEVAAELGLTPRSVRYWEEQGLLRPAARSEGDYRLYDETDVERLRFIKALRDDAGFSLADIAQLLEDEAVRERNSAAFKATDDPVERARIVADRIYRIDRQVEILQRKIDRLQTMVDDAQARRARNVAKLADLQRAAAEAAPLPDPATPTAGEAVR